MDILKRYAGEALIAGVIVAGIVYAILPKMVQADVYNPHPIPPHNSITTAMLKDSIVTPAKLQESGSYYVHALNATDTTVDNGVINSNATLPAATTINGLPYTFPATESGSNEVLTNDGSGSLSWKLPATNNIFSSLTSATTTSNATTPKAVYIDKTPVSLVAAKNVSSSYGTSQPNPLTYTLTVPTGLSNVDIYVGIDVRGSSASCPTVTIGGASATKIASSPSGCKNNPSESVYYLGGVSSGTKTISINTQGATQVNTAARVYANVATTPTNPGTCSMGSSGCTLTTTDSGSWIGGVGDGETGTCTVGGGTNLSTYSNNSNTGSGFLDSGKAFIPAGGNSVSFSASGCSSLHGIAYEIQPASAPVHGFKETDASAAGTSDAFVGFINTNAGAGNKQDVYTAGELSGFSGLTAGDVYYLSNTLGGISTTAGTVTHKVGVAISSNDLIISNGF